MKGKISTWKDDKGFGFIQPEDGSKEVFFHVSSVKTNTRRPRLGDSVLYEPMRDSQQRLKARGVVIEGVAMRSASSRTPPVAKNGPPKKNVANYLIRPILLAIIAAIAWQGYTDYQLLRKTASPTQPISNVDSAMKRAALFECDGRTHCSQMKSCAEATFFIQHCPGTKMDGDGDGVPCESQWCED